MQAELSKCEARIAKLEDIRVKLDARLADPALYQASEKGVFEALQAKSVELNTAMKRAEILWMAAVEKLDAAKGL